MKLSGKITQIQSDFGNVFMNIDDDVGCGHVGVEFSTFEKPSYLLKNEGSSIMRLMVFDSQAWADEWFGQYGGIFKEVERLDKEDVSVASNDGAEE